jgi:hypothetical protein
MADAGVRVTITKINHGFTVAVVLRRGERLDMWEVRSVETFDKAENVAKAFARQHGVAWHKVTLVSR